MDPKALKALQWKVFENVAAAQLVPLMRIGDELKLFTTLANTGPCDNARMRIVLCYPVEPRHVAHIRAVAPAAEIVDAGHGDTGVPLTTASRATGSADDVLDEAEKAIFQVAEARLRSGFLSMKVVGERSIKMIEDLTHRREPITGIATGFLQLDEWTAEIGRAHV